jgi:alpha-galactosidase
MKYFFLLTGTLYFLLSDAQSSSLLFEGAPVFHGAKIVGNRPATEFLFTVPATGARPISFSAENLPEGLNIEASTGIIRGNVKNSGEYLVKIIAANAIGTAEEELKLVIGSKLCLTPPMGWNSWNVFTNTLNEKMVMEMADAMVNSGMRDLGYQYINMDDFWHALSRDSSGKPMADPAKFPNGIKYLADYVHSKGLKLGIYSDAGTKTCGKCFGGFQYEEIDAQTYAEWGIDLLKYDFCFVPLKKKEAIRRYAKMGLALKKSGRSIVYSICNWGLFKPWEWAQDVGGNYWRTTPDIFDTWKGGNPFMMSTMKIVKRQKNIGAYAGPGHWNDPDMLIVGNYGKGKATGRNGMFKGMSDLEYQSHMSLWAMMCAPLLSSCDLRSMNDTTKNILMNGELLAINQDVLGEQAMLLKRKSGIWVYRKSMSDGSVALAIFNTTGQEKIYKLKNSLLNEEHDWRVRNIWKHADEEILKSEISLTVKAHETIVLRLAR